MAIILVRHACAAACFMLAAPWPSAAPAQQTPSTGVGQAYPAKPVRMVVSAAAGTGLDATIRVIAPKLTDYWKQPLVIDNRQGINANSTVAKATPDGYTLLVVSGSIAVRHVMFSNLPYDTLKDFAGVTELYGSNSVVVVGPALGGLPSFASVVRSQPRERFRMVSSRYSWSSMRETSAVIRSSAR